MPTPQHANKLKGAQEVLETGKLQQPPEFGVLAWSILLITQQRLHVIVEGTAVFCAALLPGRLSDSSEIERDRAGKQGHSMILTGCLLEGSQNMLCQAQ